MDGPIDEGRDQTSVVLSVLWILDMLNYRSKTSQEYFLLKLLSGEANLVLCSAPKFEPHEVKWVYHPVWELRVGSGAS